MLEKSEFVKCVHDFAIGLNEQDAERLFNLIDEDRSGSIDFDEYLYSVVGEMNDFRKNICMKAF